jgi:hypothetical protein
MSTAPNFDIDFQTKPLETLIQELPADLRSEVRSFVEFLLAKRVHSVERPSHQDLASFPLRGTVLRYDDPFAPVAESEWEALS